MANKLQEFMDVLVKAMVKQPGKRGGKFVRTKSGNIKYLTAKKHAFAASRATEGAHSHAEAARLHATALKAHRAARAVRKTKGLRDYDPHFAPIQRHREEAGFHKMNATVDRIEGRSSWNKCKGDCRTC